MNKDKLEEPERSLDQRQRKDHPTLETIPSDPAQPVIAAVHPLIDNVGDPPVSVAKPSELPVPPRVELPIAAAATGVPACPPAPADEPLTCGQMAFLANLDAGQRAAFDAWPAAKRAEVMAPHRLGFDRVMAGDAIRRLSPPPPPPPPIPRTTPELLEQLPNAPPTWSNQAAQALTQDFGVKENSRLWGEFRRIAEAIRMGRIDPAHAINAHRQAMQKGIKKPGAKFWAALRALAELEPNDPSELAAPP